MDGEAGGVGIGDEGGELRGAGGGVAAGDDAAEVRADALGIGGDFGEAGGGAEVVVIGGGLLPGVVGDELNEGQGGAEFEAEAAEFDGVEALHEHAGGGACVAVAGEEGEEGATGVLAGGEVEGGLLDLGIDTGGAAGAGVEALDEEDMLLHGAQAERAAIGREAAGVNGFTGGGGEAFADGEGAEFDPSEIDGVEAVVGTGAGGETGGDIGGGFEVDVVEDDEHAVGGHDEVLLDVIAAEGVGVGGGFQGVLGQVAGGAAVGDDEGGGSGHGGGGVKRERWEKREEGERDEAAERGELHDGEGTRGSGARASEGRGWVGYVLAAREDGGGAVEF